MEAAAGSLLGVAINREKYSFPVGKVVIKTLYPLRFDEFLRAMDQKYLAIGGQRVSGTEILDQCAGGADHDIECLHGRYGEICQ